MYLLPFDMYNYTHLLHMQYTVCVDLYFINFYHLLRNVKTVTSKDKEYWAKGTGFGTGSTSSAWDISAMLQENQSNELLSSLCLAILGEWLNVREENEGKSQEEAGKKKESEESAKPEEKVSNKVTLDSTDRVNDDIATQPTGISTSETITSSTTSSDDITPALSSGEGSQNEITEGPSEDLEIITSEGSETESLASAYLYSEDAIKTLSGSCLIPALAHYLSNDSSK